MSDIEKTHAWSHLVMFLLLFMITLAVMRFSTTTGLAVGNQTMNANGVGDFKPFLTAVGLLMAMFIAGMIVLGTSNFRRRKQVSQAEKQMPKSDHRSLEEINYQLEQLRRKLR